MNLDFLSFYDIIDKVNEELVEAKKHKTFNIAKPEQSTVTARKGEPAVEDETALLQRLGLTRPTTIGVKAKNKY